MGIKPNQLVGTSVFDVYSSRPEICELVTRSLDGESIETTLKINNEIFEVWYEPIREPSGNIRGVTGLAYEVTESRRREKELERQTKRLEEFAGVVSHDLRSPLTVAMGNLHLAQHSSEHKPELLEEVDQAHLRMRALIDDLLVYARNGKAVLSFEPVALDEVANMCWRTVSTDDATLCVETDIHINADYSRMEQLLENMFRNAIEHGGNSITVTVGEHDDGFYIADSGPGIVEKNREKVFENGYSTRRSGTGFGLAIVKQIVDAFGWEVSITESETGGAQFNFSKVKHSNLSEEQR
nr:PAS domain-containing sensor histidine kinase [Natronocalculus amylovorans]